jgi:hypothetical protein
MGTKGTRRSDRIYLRLPIQVTGTDCNNFAFADHSQTLVLSAHGALILLKRALAPEQELTLRFPATQKEAGVRVVGQIGEIEEGVCYGVEFLDPTINLWEIEFPPLSESEEAVGRVLLECERCHLREVVYLNELEVEVFQANRRLSRNCKRCGETRNWWEPVALGAEEREEIAEQLEAQAAAPPGPPPRTQNERKYGRVELDMVACMRHPQFGDEVVIPENLSRGGLCFKSRKLYSDGVIVEVAVPYSEGGANIFAPAKVVRRMRTDEEGFHVYGVEYIAVHKGWPSDLNVPDYRREILDREK